MAFIRPSPDFHRHVNSYALHQRRGYASGIKILPIKHNKKRRTVWHDYTRKGTYLLTIHICTDDEGRCYEGLLLSHIVGEPMAEEHPHTELTELGRLVDHKIDAITLWEYKYNDCVLIDDKAVHSAYDYVEKNAWYWQMETFYPQLFQHALHLTFAGNDYRAYGCMFLLKHPERRQVFCHRLTRRGQLTDEEWQRSTASWDNIKMSIDKKSLKECVK